MIAMTSPEHMTLIASTSPTHSPKSMMRRSLSPSKDLLAKKRMLNNTKLQQESSVLPLTPNTREETPIKGDHSSQDSSRSLRHRTPLNYYRKLKLTPISPEPIVKKQKHRPSFPSSSSASSAPLSSSSSSSSNVYATLPPSSPSSDNATQSVEPRVSTHASHAQRMTDANVSINGHPSVAMRNPPSAKFVSLHAPSTRDQSPPGGTMNKHQEGVQTRPTIKLYLGQQSRPSKTENILPTPDATPSSSSDYTMTEKKMIPYESTLASGQRSHDTSLQSVNQKQMPPRRSVSPTNVAIASSIHTEGPSQTRVPSSTSGGTITIKQNPTRVSPRRQTSQKRGNVNQ